MTESLPSAEEHLRRGEQRRACAEVSQEAGHFGLAHSHRDRAVVDYLAALVTCAIWPARLDEAMRRVDERDVARAELARLQVVADAARVFCESEPDSPARTDAYERLFAAVRRDS